LLKNTKTTTTIVTILKQFYDLLDCSSFGLRAVEHEYSLLQDTELASKRLEISLNSVSSHFHNLHIIASVQTANCLKLNQQFNNN